MVELLLMQTISAAQIILLGNASLCVPGSVNWVAFANLTLRSGIVGPLRATD